MNRLVREIFSCLYPRDWRARLVVFFAILTLVISKLLTLIAPFFYKESIDALAPAVETTAVALPWAFILAYGCARLSIQLFDSLRAILFGTIIQREIHNIQLHLLSHLHALSLRFHLERRTGSLTQAIMRGLNSIETLINGVVLTTMPTLLEICLVGVTLTKLYSYSYAIILLLTIVIYSALTFWLSQRRTDTIRQLNAADDATSAITIDSLLNYETIKYFSREAHEQRRLSESQAKLRTAAVRNLISWSILSLIQAVVVALSLITVTLMAAQDVKSHRMKIGDYILINTYLLQLYIPLGALSTIYLGGRRALVDLESMCKILDSVPEVENVPHAKPLVVKAGEICFTDVQFEYDPLRPLLKGISFVVPAGKRVAIVGSTGAGKSTIGKLLFRFYDVTNGHILIDGQDIKFVTLDSLRAAIGVVPQDTVLFNDTIYYNIAYGHRNPDDEPVCQDDVERAATLAQIKDLVVSLPQEYATPVGERGLKLSGGEKQRIAIARTILKAPKIFLFDEATSALDTRTEAEIQTCLRNIASDCTTLIIAHRLSTVVDADNIIVLDKGTIVEQGSHARLLALDGLYAEMWHRQRPSA
jgi:ATP-binding cassette, subfamily B, heavy metal transporter